MGDNLLKESRNKYRVEIAPRANSEREPGGEVNSRSRVDEYKYDAPRSHLLAQRTSISRALISTMYRTHPEPLQSALAGLCLPHLRLPCRHRVRLCELSLRGEEDVDRWNASHAVPTTRLQAAVCGR